MKNCLIKLTGERDLFYDSKERLYRYRMHCEVCGNVSGCRCFNTLEKAEDFSTDKMDLICSYKCYISYLMNNDKIYVEETMKEMGTISLSKSLKSWYIPKFMRSYHVKILRFINLFTIWRLKWYKLKLTGRISEEDAWIVIDEMDIDSDKIQGESC